MDQDKQSQMIAQLKQSLMTRGIKPEPYINALLTFQTLVNSLKTHDQIDVASKVVEAMAIVVSNKHTKFHKGGGDDEKQNASLN